MICLACVAQAQTPVSLSASLHIGSMLRSDRLCIKPAQQPLRAAKGRAAAQAAGEAANRRRGAEFQCFLQRRCGAAFAQAEAAYCLRTAIDPVSFGVAGFDAASARHKTTFPATGRELQGYGKRWGAAYADNFDGTLLGNAIFPILLKEDPRYFRRGDRKLFLPPFLLSFDHRMVQKGQRKVGPELLKCLGNLAAGGISNLYYPASDRGADLTFERGFTVTAYGAFGGVFNEFWPDVARKIFKDSMAKLQPMFLRRPHRPQRNAPAAR